MRFVPIAYCAVALALQVLVACGRSEEQAPVEIIRPVRAIQVLDAESLSRREFTGTARAVQRSILSLEVPGRLTERPVDVGDEVEKGQLLAKLDPRDFENVLSAAKAAEKQTRALRDRVAEAHKVRAVSDQDLTDAEERLRAAVAEVKIRAKKLDDSELRAPHGGIVSATYVERFDVVQAKQPVLRLLDTSEVEMVIDIPEDLIGNVRYLEDIQVRFDAFPDQALPAHVSEVGSEASLATRTYPVTLSMNQPGDLRIEPGMTGQARGRVDLPGGTDWPGPVVPRGAVAVDRETGASYVWVIDEKSKKVSRKEVTVGSPGDGGILVEDGLRPGEWIATAGANTLREGQRVEPVASSETGHQARLPQARTVPAGEATIN
jgi:RND family efflux transporter MFP subunit